MKNFKAKIVVFVAFLLSCANVSAQLDGPPPPPPVAPINDLMPWLILFAIIFGAYVLVSKQKFSSK